MFPIAKEHGLAICGEVTVLPKELKFFERLTGTGQKASLHICHHKNKTQSGLFFSNITSPWRHLTFEKLFICLTSKKTQSTSLIIGKMLLSVDNLPTLRFLIECCVSTDRCLIMGSLESMSGDIVLFGHLKVTELGAIVGFDNSGPLLGLMGGFRLGSANIWGFAACGFGKVVKPAVFMAILPEIRAGDLTALFTGEQPELFSNFNFLSLESFDMAISLDLEPDELDPFQLADRVNPHILDKGLKLSSPDMHIWPMQDGALVTDLKNCRSYRLTRRPDHGYDLCLPPQFYLNATDNRFQFGKFSIAPGMFMCAAVTILGVRTGICIQIGSEGLMLHQQIDEINLQFAKLSASKDIPTEIDPLDAAAQFLTGRHIGPVIYLRLTRDGCEAYIDARLKILDIFDFSTRAFLWGGQIKIDCMLSLLMGLANVRFQIGAGYEDFEASSFKISLGVELANFDESVEKFMEEVACENGALEETEDIHLVVSALIKEYKELDDRLALLQGSDNGAKSQNASFYTQACAEGFSLAKSILQTTSAIVDANNYKRLTYLKKVEIEIDLEGHSIGKILRGRLSAEAVLWGRPRCLSTVFTFNTKKLDALLKSKIFQFLRTERDEAIKAPKMEERGVIPYGFGGLLNSREAQDEDFARFVAAEERFISGLGAEQAKQEAWLIENYYILDTVEQQMNALLNMLAVEDTVGGDDMKRDLSERRNKILQFKDQIRQNIYDGGQ